MQTNRLTLKCHQVLWPNNEYPKWSMVNERNQSEQGDEFVYDAFGEQTGLTKVEICFETVILGTGD